MAAIANVVARGTIWAAGIFYRVERVGADLPDGPILIVSNHPNKLMDPLLALYTARRRVRILAKAPLFRLPIFGQQLRALDALPVYRQQDDPTQLHRNKRPMQEAVRELRSGGAVLIFPEGRSHSEPALAPLKTGAARMALAAEEETEWELGLRIVPTGLTYHRKHRFRSRVVIAVSDPIEVGRWRAAYENDHAAAVGSLTGAIARGLERCTLNLEATEDRELIETAELLYARAKGWAEWREREPLKERLPRFQRIAEAILWLRSRDPQRFDALAGSVRSYRRGLTILGSGEADVPPRYELWRVVRFTFREGAILGFSSPIAALGAIAWYLPYALSGLVSRLMKPNIETVATVQLLSSVVAYPATLIVWTALAAWAAGWLAALAMLLVLPPLGFAALAWRDRRKEVWEDVRLFFKLVRRPELRDRFADQRAMLASEFDAVASELEGERASSQWTDTSPLSVNKGQTG